MVLAWLGSKALAFINVTKCLDLTPFKELTYYHNAHTSGLHDFTSGINARLS